MHFHLFWTFVSDRTLQNFVSSNYVDRIFLGSWKRQKKVFFFFFGNIEFFVFYSRQCVYRHICILQLGLLALLAGDETGGFWLPPKTKESICLEDPSWHISRWLTDPFINLADPTFHNFRTSIGKVQNSESSKIEALKLRIARSGNKVSYSNAYFFLAT